MSNSDTVKEDFEDWFEEVWCEEVRDWCGYVSAKEAWKYQQNKIDHLNNVIAGLELELKEVYASIENERNFTDLGDI